MTRFQVAHSQPPVHDLDGEMMERDRRASAPETRYTPMIGMALIALVCSECPLSLLVVGRERSQERPLRGQKRWQPVERAEARL